ncbi:hypothetical protein L210DRAFT_3550110, partial [Boletus edulis BED1]
CEPTGPLQAPTNKKDSGDMDTVLNSRKENGADRRAPCKHQGKKMKPRQIPQTTSPSSMTCVSPRESHWRGLLDSGAPILPELFAPRRLPSTLSNSASAPTSMP